MLPCYVDSSEQVSGAIVPANLYFAAILTAGVLCRKHDQVAVWRNFNAP